MEEIKLTDNAIKFQLVENSTIIELFVINKEYFDLTKDERIKHMKGLLDYCVDEIGRLRYKI